MSTMSTGRIFAKGQSLVSVPRTSSVKAAYKGERFDQLLQQRLQGDKVRISAHASARLRSAGVRVDEKFEERLRAAVDKAAAKGSRSSLVLLDELALVVSVQNRTVITAVDSARMQENVFTNIDSAVIS